MEIDDQNDATITNGKKTQSIWQGFFFSLCTNIIRIRKPFQVLPQFLDPILF